MILDLDVSKKEGVLKNPLYYRLLLKSPEFTIKYELSNIIEGNFPHVGVSARQGFNIVYKKDNCWFNVELYARESPKTINMRSMIKNFDESYEVIVYGPILSTLDKLTVEVPEGCTVQLVDDVKQEVLVVGGINSFGIGCTSQGVMFSNILARHLDFDIFHLTFNNRNYLKDVFLFLENNDISNYDYIIFELDYFNQDDEFVSEYLLKILEILLDHTNVLIGWSCISPNKSYKINNLNNLLYGGRYNKNMVICDFSEIYDSNLRNMCTSSDYFINDTTNIFIFKKLSKVIRDVKNGVFAVNR